MERTASDAEKRRRRWLPWWLLAGSLGVTVLGGWGASRSISSLMRRVEQLEREASESEARVAELQVLRDSMTRRLRLLEQQQQGLATQNAALNKRAGGFKFENGKYPNDAECLKPVGFDEVGDEVSLAQEFGRLKHAAAFACFKARLPPKLRENFTVEPRYKPDPEMNGVVLTDKGLDTLHPDFVVHGTRNATDVQCVYELKFPCSSAHKLDPRSSRWVEAQLKAYQKLSNRCPAAVISPAGLFQLGIP